MNKEEALEFLRLNQPMPSEYDDDLDSETVDAWDAAREYFTENPCEEAIPLFLGSIGEGYLFGTYQTLDNFSRFSSPTSSFRILSTPCRRSRLGRVVGRRSTRRRSNRAAQI